MKYHYFLLFLCSLFGCQTTTKLPARKQTLVKTSTTVSSVKSQSPANSKYIVFEPANLDPNSKMLAKILEETGEASIPLEETLQIGALIEVREGESGDKKKIDKLSMILVKDPNNVKTNGEDSKKATPVENILEFSIFYRGQILLPTSEAQPGPNEDLDLVKFGDAMQRPVGLFRCPEQLSICWMSLAKPTMIELCSGAYDICSLNYDSNKGWSLTFK